MGMDVYGKNPRQNKPLSEFPVLAKYKKMEEKDKDNGFIANSIAIAEKELLKEDLNDQSRFLINHKIDILKSLSVN